VPRRAFQTVFVVLPLVWLAVSLILWNRQRREVVESFRERASSFVAGVRDNLEQVVEVGCQDALTLVSGPAARRFAAGDATAREELRESFVAYALARMDVFQVRLLAADGRELLRVERSGGHLVERGELQDKSDRYYFRHAAELAPGQVFVSAIDLNIEHGALERPLRPTTRYSAPIHAPSGTLFGVIVVNQQAEALLGHVVRQRGHLAGDLVLVDRNGTYLSHPDRAREWGAPDLLATGRGLDEDHPELANALRRGDDGPLSAPGSIAVGARVRGVPSDPTVVLLTEEGDALAAEARQFLPLAIGLASAAVLVVVLLAALWRSRQLAAELARESFLRREIALREKRLERAQEQLVASARLAALSETAAALAHELRNPLAAIVNSAALLRRDAELDPDGRKLMGIVLDECGRLERAVASFLDLAQRPTPRPERVDLAATVQKLVELATHAPDLSTLAITAEADTTAPLPVQIDPDELSHVLWNLLRNAATANRRTGGKRIWVRARTSPRPAADRVWLEVEDEGPGPPDASARSQRGGLGLIVVAGVVARASGEFFLEPGENGGACARVVLPRAACGGAT
jgi:signal transduction histidine kinase